MSAAGERATYPGAVPPDRVSTVDSSGLRIAVHEWGAPDAPPIVLFHGGFDFSRTFDVFAPLLAAEGWRAVAWDARGHGDSEHAALYSWDADVRDALAVLDAVSEEAVVALGHSKGGGVAMQLADALPHRVRALINFDGLPSKQPVPDIADHDRTRLLASELEGWLDHRRRAAGAVRRAGTLDDLAARRGAMNPRLTPEWLRYLASVGGRQDPDGWRWKLDPSMRFGGFGPWRPEWSMLRMRSLGMPFLGVLGLIPEPMGWGTRPEDVVPYLPDGARFEVYDDSGHFLHIEHPQRTAAVVREFLEARL
jgi:pimeloyl-ACP methyl ester carboxylesterase